MPFSLSSFVRDASFERLDAYIRSVGLQIRPVNDPHGSLAYAKSVISQIREFGDEASDQVRADLERVNQLTDDIGERAMLDCGGFDSTSIREVLAALECRKDRALWLYTLHPRLFASAEAIRFANRRVNGRSWSQFIGPLGPAVTAADLDLSTFRDAVRSVFQEIEGTGRHLTLEAIDVPSPDGGAPYILIGGLFDGLAETTRHFRRGEVARLLLRPAREFALTYSFDTGAIDVVCERGGGPLRTRIAEAFCSDVLSSDCHPERPEFRRVMLGSLRQRRSFSVDSNDGITSVRVTRLCAVRDGPESGRILIDAPYPPATIWDAITSWTSRHGLPTDAKVVRAELKIIFAATPEHPKGKTLTVALVSPNASTLKERTEAERLIGEKYLTRWGLVAPAAREAA